MEENFIFLIIYIKRPYFLILAGMAMKYMRL